MDVTIYTFVTALLLQTFDIQIFNADYVIVVDMVPRELMEKIVSLILDFIIYLVQLVYEFLMILSAFLSSG